MVRWRGGRSRGPASRAVSSRSSSEPGSSTRARARSELEGQRQPGEPLAGGGDRRRLVGLGAPSGADALGPVEQQRGGGGGRPVRDGRAPRAARRRTPSHRAPAAAPGWSSARSGPAPPRPGRPRPARRRAGARRCRGRAAGAGRAAARPRRRRRAGRVADGTRPRRRPPGAPGRPPAAAPARRVVRRRRSARCTAVATASARRVLPTPAGADQGDQPARPEQVADPGDVVVAPDERGGGHRQVTRERAGAAPGPGARDAGRTAASRRVRWPSSRVSAAAGPGACAGRDGCGCRARAR